MAASAASANENQWRCENNAKWQRQHGVAKAAINNISIKYEKHQWRNGGAKMATQ
jgi:hypothetical protein